MGLGGARDDACSERTRSRRLLRGFLNLKFDTRDTPNSHFKEETKLPLPEIGIYEGNCRRSDLVCRPWLSARCGVLQQCDIHHVQP